MLTHQQNNSNTRMKGYIMTSELNNQTNSNTAYNLAIDLLTTYKNKYGFFISSHTRAEVFSEWVREELIVRFIDSDGVEYRLVDDYYYDEVRYFSIDDWNYALTTLSEHLRDLMNDLESKDKLELTMNNWQRVVLDYSYSRAQSILLDQVKECFSDHDCDITCEDSIRDFFSRIPRYIDADFKENMPNMHSID